MLFQSCAGFKAPRTSLAERFVGLTYIRDEARSAVNLGSTKFRLRSSQLGANKSKTPRERKIRNVGVSLAAERSTNPSIRASGPCDSKRRSN